MSEIQLSSILERLVERLAAIAGVEAVTLGGSRAQGVERPDSDWDFGLYYRGRINPDDIRELGFPGHVVEPGAWGRLVNGGGWLMIEGQHVDVLYRNLDFVEHWTSQAQQGRFEVDNVAGHIVGLPTYVLAGELALGKVLTGSVPRVSSFPDALRRTAPPWWNGNAAFSLMFADGYAAAGDVVSCAGSLARAVIACGHALLAERGEWALNEKRIVRRAGLTEAAEVIASVGKEQEQLAQSVSHMRTILGLARPQGMQADEVVRTKDALDPLMLQRSSQ